jgi:hypothetical protein
LTKMFHIYIYNRVIYLQPLAGRRDHRHAITYLDGRSSDTHHAKSSKGNIAVSRTASGKGKSLGSRGEAHHGGGGCSKKKDP